MTHKHTVYVCVCGVSICVCERERERDSVNRQYKEKTTLVFYVRWIIVIVSSLRALVFCNDFFNGIEMCVVYVLGATYEYWLGLIFQPFYR